MGSVLARLLFVVGVCSTAACTFGEVNAEADAEIPGDDAQTPDSTGPDAPESDAGPEDAPADAAADAPEPDAGMQDAGPHPIGDLIPGVATLVGDSQGGFADGPRENSLFRNPVNVIATPEGDLLVADFENGAIRQVTPEGITTTLTWQQGFRRPFGMIFTQSGRLIVQTDTNSVGQATGALWDVDLETGVATLRRNNVGRLRAMVLRSDGQIVAADIEQHQLVIFNPTTNSIAPFAGLAGVSGYQDGPAQSALFNRPLGLAIDGDDQIFVSDSFNHRIRLVTANGYVTTLAGSGEARTVDGTAFGAAINAPAGIVLAPDQTLYVCEFTGGAIRRIRAGQVRTVAGGTRGFADGMNPLEASFNICEGMTLSGAYLYSSDGNGGTGENFNRVRRIELSAID